MSFHSQTQLVPLLTLQMNQDLHIDPEKIEGEVHNTNKKTLKKFLTLVERYNAISLIDYNKIQIDKQNKDIFTFKSKLERLSRTNYRRYFRRKDRLRQN